MRIAKILGTTALVAVLGLAAGCGSDDNPKAGTTPSPPETMTTSPALPPATSSAPTPSQGSSSPAASASSPTAPTSDAPTSSAPPVDIAQPPTTYVQAQAHIQAARDGSTSSLSRFSTPGDSIYCVLKSKYLAPSCELRSGAVKDSQVCAKAPSQFVGRVSIRKSGAEPECNTDTIRQPGADTVQPTALVSSGTVACAVEDIGVTCIDSSLHKGFFLTPGAYKIF